MNVSRHLGLGSSVCHVLRESEVLGYPRSNKAVEPGGSATEGPHARGGSELGSYEDLMNVSRNLAMGGSICHVLRRSDTLGDPRSNETVKLGGSVKEGPHVRARAELGSYEDLMNVSRHLAMGSSSCCVSQGTEALGGPRSNEAVEPGGSAREGPHVRWGSELRSYELRSELEVEIESYEVQ